MKLSIFIAGYRTENWMNVYNSVPSATTIQDYELVFVGPKEPPQELLDKKNVRFIQDFGNPSRCYQLGLLHSQGEYVVWTADDGMFSPTLSIDKGFDILPKHHKGIVTFKYLEGPFEVGSYKKNLAAQMTKSEIVQGSDNYWKMGGHKIMAKLPYIQNHYWLLMVGLMRCDYMMEIGGFDCSYEQPGIGCHDLAVRLQNDGAEVIMGVKLMDISNSPSEHGPIEQAQIQNDLPLLKSMYKNPMYSNRTKIPFDNWKDCPNVWDRRFG